MSQTFSLRATYALSVHSGLVSRSRSDCGRITLHSRRAAVRHRRQQLQIVKAGNLTLSVIECLKGLLELLAT